MKIAIAVVAAALVFTPIIASAHGEKPQAAHGGEIQDAQGVWVELVVKGSDVNVYVITEDHKPIAAAQITGTATVLFEGKTYKVELNPGQANSVQGKLPVAVTGRVVATVALKVGDKPASARFVGA
jgi:Cu/Ag efflux protein CusF